MDCITVSVRLPLDQSLNIKLDALEFGASINFYKIKHFNGHLEDK